MQKEKETEIQPSGLKNNGQKVDCVSFYRTQWVIPTGQDSQLK